MKFMIYLLTLGYVGGSILPVHPGGIGGLFKGPNSETIIKGPDGSVITAAAEGGEVHTKSTDLQPIVVADPVDTLPVISTKIETVQTVNVPSIPLAPISHEDPHIIETELVDAPDVEPDQASDLVGPSGTISTRGSKSIISGPASTTISEPVKKIPIVPVVPIANPVLQAIPLIESSSVLTNQPIVPIIEAQKPIHLPVVDNLSTNGVISNAGVIESSTPIVSSRLSPAQLVDNGHSTSVSSTINPIQVISSTTAKPLLVSTAQPSVLSNHQANLGFQQVLHQQTNPVILSTAQPPLISDHQAYLGLQQVPHQQINPLVASTAGPPVLTDHQINLALHQQTNPLVVSTAQTPVLTDHQTNLGLQHILQQQTTLNQHQPILANPTLISKQINNISPAVRFDGKGLGSVAIDSSSILSNVNIQKIPPNNNNGLPVISSTPLPVTVTGKIDLNQLNNLQQQPNNVPLGNQAVNFVIPDQALRKQLLNNQLLANGHPNIVNSNSNINQLYLESAGAAGKINEIALLRDTNPIQVVPSNAEISNVNAESAQLTVGSTSALVGQDPISQAVWNRYGRQTLKKE